MMEKWIDGKKMDDFYKHSNVPLFQYSNIPIIHIMFNKRNMSIIKEDGF